MTDALLERVALIAYQQREQVVLDDYLTALAGGEWAIYRALADAYMDLAMERLRLEGGLCERCGAVLRRDPETGRMPRRWCSDSCEARGRVAEQREAA